LPIIGYLILQFIKRQNKIHEMVAFATSCHPGREGGLDDDEGEPQPLIPLYYPIHEMTAEEKEMHQRMVEEAPLDLHELSEMRQQRNGLEGDGEEFRHWTISDYTSRYLNGTTTPSQVVDRIIKVIEEMNAHGKKSGILTQMNAKELRLQASESTKRYRNGNIMGVLDGVPIVVKDGSPTKGFSVTLATSFLADPSEKDAVPIARLRQQGALVVGMANLHEIGLGTTGFNLTYGTPKNPYGKDRHIHYYTGGSSSGSAAAVSMGLVPLAVGLDGGGSIRIPSSLCGCVGLKPTFKRIAFDSIGAPSVAHMGPMTNNIHDAALAYAIMAGETDNDHRFQSKMQPPVHLHAYMTNTKESGGMNSLKGIRIGVFEEHIEDAEANVVSATKKAIEYYQSRGAEIIPIILPHLQSIHFAHSVTITTEMMSSMEPHYTDHFTDLSPETRITLAVGKSWTACEFLAAQKIRSYAMRHMEDVFKNSVDVILSPATPCCAPIFREDAFSHGESNLAQTANLMKYIVHGNLIGIPAMVFPIAYDDETSLPISLQIQAAHWREDLLFHVARESQGILKKGIAKPTMYVDILQ